MHPEETMKKLQLDLDRLAVESFETVRASDARAGTVQAREYTTPCECTICKTCETCDLSCMVGTC
jgi:hypothetical protein